MAPSLQTANRVHPPVSVIIPTYNRKDSLLRTLDSLSRQTYPAERLEVIVVDDGGSDGTEAIAQGAFPFALRYILQENRGDARARNYGAQAAQGEILQFLDDDIRVEPGFISAIVREHADQAKLMVIGNLFPLPSSSPSVFERTTTVTHFQSLPEPGETRFTEILSGVLSMRREAYLELGMMQPIVQSGSSVWCDVEFAYRATLQGYTLRRVAEAIAYHDDYAIRDFAASCARVRRAASAGAELFQKHPELRMHLPMFRDKGPISWRSDGPLPIMRKIARRAVSSSLAVAAMERTLRLLERRQPVSPLLPLLYRWINSSYIYHGYRAGLRELKRRQSGSEGNGR